MKKASLVTGIDTESLYQELLAAFYVKADRRRAKTIAKQLESHLLETPEYAQSIRGEEVRSIIAELRDDLSLAIQGREAEIRKILELHSLAINTPGWPYVFERYNFSDVSDRLDLLALLYDRRGDLDRAIEVLLESKGYCRSHKISFDAQDVLEELLEARMTGVSDPKKNRDSKRPVQRRPATARK